MCLRALALIYTYQSIKVNSKNLQRLVAEIGRRLTPDIDQWFRSAGENLKDWIKDSQLWGTKGNNNTTHSCVCLCVCVLIKFLSLSVYTYSFLYQCGQLIYKSKVVEMKEKAKQYTHPIFHSLSVAARNQAKLKLHSVVCVASALGVRLCV